MKNVLGSLEYTEENEYGNKFVSAAFNIKQINNADQQTCLPIPEYQLSLIKQDLLDTYEVNGQRFLNRMSDGL